MHWAAGLALVAMLVLTVADIAGRTLFNNPVPGTVEVTALILVVVVFLGMGYSEDLGDHITVDLLYVRVGKRFKAVLDVFANILSIIVIGLMSFQIYHFALRQRDSGAETPVLQWPIWPFAIIAAFGTLLYSISIGSKLVLRALGEPTDAEAQMTLGEVEVSGPEI